MEWFDSFWGWTLPIGGGVTIGAIVVAVLSLIKKSVVKKVTDKVSELLESKLVVSEITKAVVDKLQGVSYKQSLEPIVKSEMVKVGEGIMSAVTDKFADLEKSVGGVLSCTKALASYFDDSIAISDEKKMALHNAIAEAEHIDLSHDIEMVMETAVADRKLADTTTEKRIKVVR